MAEEEYVEALKEKLRKLRGEIADRQGRIQGLSAELEGKQRLAEHILELLKAENVSVEAGELSSSGEHGASELAYRELAKTTSRKGRHYKELATWLLSRGVIIPGRNPAANLLAHISRDNRFVRVASGTYALSEWGVKPAARKRRKVRRRRKAGVQ